jgi:membrane protease subunit (stomatin/prohibitin family)
MGLLKIIEIKDMMADDIVKRLDLKGDFIAKGSALTVRESQVCVFCDKGRMADVFLPGYYKLDTNNVPLLTKLMSWKYGFESPFKSDIFFVSTKQFIDQKWGTSNPIMIRDAEFGPVRLRAFGSYAFKVGDAYIFMQEISSTGGSYTTKEITNYLKSKLVTGITDAIGELKIPVLDMASNQMELGEILKTKLESFFKGIGLVLTDFNLENLSLPPELEKAMDQAAAAGMRRRNLDVELQLAQADAMREAAKNPGMAGAGMGMGIGMAFGNQMMNNINNNQNVAQTQNVAPTSKCNKCGASIPANSKFCPECGNKTETSDTKFCPECGTKNPANSKFCGNCGFKL